MLPKHRVQSNTHLRPAASKAASECRGRTRPQSIAHCRPYAKKGSALTLLPHLKASRFAVPFRPVRSLAEDKESDGSAVKRETWRIGATRGGCAGLKLKLPVPRPTICQNMTTARVSKRSTDRAAVDTRECCWRQPASASQGISALRGGRDLLSLSGVGWRPGRGLRCRDSR